MSGRHEDGWFVKVEEEKMLMLFFIIVLHFIYILFLCSQAFTTESGYIRALVDMDKDTEQIRRQ